MSELTSERNLTKKIYEAMQLPYLSERHDAILALINEEKVKELELVCKMFERYSWGNYEPKQILDERLQALKQKEN